MKMAHTDAELKTMGQKVADAEEASACASGFQNIQDGRGDLVPESVKTLIINKTQEAAPYIDPDAK
jgi:hypothetical protein